MGQLSNCCLRTVLTLAEPVVLTALRCRLRCSSARTYFMCHGYHVFSDRFGQRGSVQLSTIQTSDLSRLQRAPLPAASAFLPVHDQRSVTRAPAQERHSIDFLATISIDLHQNQQFCTFLREVSGPCSWKYRTSYGQLCAQHLCNNREGAHT